MTKYGYIGMYSTSGGTINILTTDLNQIQPLIDWIFAKFPEAQMKQHHADPGITQDYQLTIDGLEHKAHDVAFRILRDLMESGWEPIDVQLACFHLKYRYPEQEVPAEEGLKLC